MPLSLHTPVTSLHGVGQARAEALQEAKILTVQDILFTFPKSYRDNKIRLLSADLCDKSALFHLTVQNNPTVALLPGGRKIFRFTACDSEENKATVMYFNQPYLRGQIHKGDSFYFFGELKERNGAFFLFSPEREKSIDPSQALKPVYPAVGSVTPRVFAKLADQALKECGEAIPENLPDDILKKYALPDRALALFTIHAPKCAEELEKAKKRFAFENAFFLALKVVQFRESRSIQKLPAFHPVSTEEFEALLPFSLTQAQRQAWLEIQNDMIGTGNIPAMNRLLQGDVGSGKTILAALAAFLCARNGKSTLLMAPTEILASQHYEKLSPLFQKLGIHTILLTGSTPKKERESELKKIHTSIPYLLIGTHALIEEKVHPENLGLTITDEQQRFGAQQRNRLNEKGAFCHSLVMTATPIPRSLAMFLYSGSGISVIDALPPGRQKIDTFYVGENKKDRIYHFLEERLQNGERAYFVCPLIEKNDEICGMVSAKEQFEDLKKRFPDVPIGYLHGKMKPIEKNEVMRAFKDGKIKILVSTTVVEVGVDVPEATLMVIINAERFGLSQLHQLRGRVGRGNKKSYCILVSSSSAKSSRERLKELCDTSDGFRLAEFDLKQRGPGEFFGDRQSGYFDSGFFELFSSSLMQEILEDAKNCLPRFSKTNADNKAIFLLN